MITASAQKMPDVVFCDSVLNCAPIVVRNLSDVAVAIHDLGNQKIYVGNFTWQVKSRLVICCILIFLFFVVFFFFFSDYFPTLMAMVSPVAAPPTLFAVTVRVFVFNGVHLIVGMVPLPFCCSREFSLALG
jgi:hypothetical protein